MSYIKKQEYYDVIVVGGGLAGVCAAIAASRNGAKTAIVQQRSMFGGNSSSEIRMHVVGASCHMAKSNVNETGILLELLLENKARNPNQSFSIWDSVLWEKVKFQDNLTSYLNASMDDVLMQDNVIEGIVCHQTTTETEYHLYGKIFIDATGHGSLGKLSGAEYRMGSEPKAMYNEPNAPDIGNEDTMGNTLMFLAVDMGHKVEFKKPFCAYDFSEDDLKYRHHYNCVSSFEDGGKVAKFKEGESNTLPDFADMNSGYWWIELGGQYDDIIAQSEEIKDELLKCVYGVWNHIKNCGNHGAENYALDWIGMVPGCRESRRLIGDYVLNENDVRSNRIFEDAVAYGGWPMDNHIRGGIFDFDKNPSVIYNFTGIYTIPYRSYYSKNILNLMMAGRDISTSKMAFGSTRVMATCAIGGQACGTAAALAVQHKCYPKEILNNINELQQQLIKDDCYIPGYVNKDSDDKAKRARISSNSFVKDGEPQKVIDGITRMIDGIDHCWKSLPINEKEAVLYLEFKEKEKLSSIRLIFDPNLSREIMPSMTQKVIIRQIQGMPEELVKDYTVTVLDKNQVVKVINVNGNIQRLNVIDFGENCYGDSVSITVHSTYGCENARIYEVRIY